MKKSTAAALLLATPAMLAAEPAPRFDPARLSAIVQTISSDAYEGRGPATPAETKTVDYIIARMKADGLQPGGDLNGGRRAWTQAVPLLRAEIVGAPMLSLDLAGQAMPLTIGQDIAVRAPLTGAKQVTLTNVPLIFVGYGVAAPERQWDDFKGVDVRGKLIVVLINDPDFETARGNPTTGVFGGKAMTYYGRWTYKYEEAARRGAAGVLIVHETGPAAYGWNTVKNSNDNAQFDIVRADPAAAHTPFETWIQRDLAVRIFQASGLDLDAEKLAAQRRDFRPVPLKATLSARYDVSSGVITSHNVVGILPGTTHPDETILYTAHWDHLGIGQPDAKGDRIYNGAIDNGTGIAGLLELGRAFAMAQRTQRSVVFMAVTAEEKGLLGSEYYADHPLYPLGKTVALLNQDALNPDGPERNFSISGNARLGLLDDLIAVGARHGRSYAPDPEPEKGHFYRSDHFSLAKRGVPAISFEAGDDLVNGGVARGEALKADYVKYRYHQPADEWSADWDMSGQAEDEGLLYELGRDLANSREWPNWSADSEFRAARDASAAERK